MVSIAAPIGWLRNWRTQRILRRSTLTGSAWHRICEELPVLAHLSDGELARLRDLVVVFLHCKKFQGGAGLEVDEHMRLTISAQACLLVLNLGMDYYRGWHTVIVLPDRYRAQRLVQDKAGVVHHYDEALAGEAWTGGPVVLSWHDVLLGGQGYNVIIHEFAHKLDMLNGEDNGFPPLHRDMDTRLWSKIFSQAYRDFCQRVEQGNDTLIDPYGATSPGEFFAVLCEAFFEIPVLLRSEYPAVYRQLCAFFRQQPAERSTQGFVSSRV